jgi:hypothetical protein
MTMYARWPTCRGGQLHMLHCNKMS